MESRDGVKASVPPTPGAMAAGGWQAIVGLLMGAATIVLTVLVRSRMAPGYARMAVTLVILVGGFFLFRSVFDAGVAGVEAWLVIGVRGGVGGSRVI